jgi:hypothetical protein
MNSQARPLKFAAAGVDSKNSRRKNPLIKRESERQDFPFTCVHNGPSSSYVHIKPFT